MRASIVTVFIIISACLLVSCRTPTATPPATATSIPDTASATLPPITTLAIASVTPASTIEPTTTPAPSPQPIEVTFRPSASPRPKITSTPQPITITLFAIEPATIDPGDAITITWQTTGGQVNLIPINPLGQMSAPVPVANTGSKVITTDISQRNFMLFMLNVHDARLNKDLQAFASVTLRCPDAWFFPNGPSSCPQSAPITGKAAIQHFEHGFMIWLQPRDNITILYSDDQFSPKWDIRQDNYVDGQPQDDPTLIPPKGKFQPIRGFGLVWRDDQATTGFRVRDRLGWAIDEEQPFQGVLQCNSAVKYTTCYLEDNQGKTIELKPERSAWNYWGE